MSAQEKMSVQRAFKTRACIDWLRVRIVTKEPTQFRWIQDVLTRILNQKEDVLTHVKTINPGAGNSSCEFEFSLHDEHANSHNEIERVLAALAKFFPFAAPVTISAIEIALDFRPRVQDARAVTEMVHRLQSQIAVRGNARQYDPVTDTYTRIDEFRANHPDPDKTLRIGNEGENLGWRVYFKRTNNKQPLDPSQHRARAEFTLSGDALSQYGLNELADLQHFRFESTAGLLHFRVMKPLVQIIAGKNQLYADTVERFYQKVSGSVAGYPFGWRKFERKPDGTPRHGGRSKIRKYNAHTVADDELNRIVRKRLADLSKTFRT